MVTWANVRGVLAAFPRQRQGADIVRNRGRFWPILGDPGLWPPVFWSGEKRGYVKNKMTIIVFLVDTSASMNQRTYLGMSLMDVAKGAVDTFLKVNLHEFDCISISRSVRDDVLCSLFVFIQIRARDPASRMDRYMLLTFEDPPTNVKVRLTASGCAVSVGSGYPTAQTDALALHLATATFSTGRGGLVLTSLSIFSAGDLFLARRPFCLSLWAVHSGTDLHRKWDCQRPLS